MTGVAKVIPISKPYKLVSRELHPEPSVVKVGDVEIGGDRLVMIAGPCGVEERSRTLDIARAVRKHGAVLFRGGAYKPRTSPYSFQGLEEEGLKILAEVRERTGLGVVTEMTSPSQADLMVKYVDMVQVGARNMQNFELLKTVGRMGKPVLLKRGMSATIQDWAHGRRVCLVRGQRPGRALRTGHPNVRELHPQHPGPDRGPGDQATVPFADHYRPVPRHRAADKAARSVGRPWPPERTA